jgi:hypothetical protein
MPYISDEEYSIIKAASAVKLGIEAFAAEEAIRQQKIQIWNDAYRKAYWETGFKIFFKWFAISLFLMTVGCAILGNMPK